MNCPKCGLLIGHGTMGTTLPLCQCQWNSHQNNFPNADWVVKKEDRIKDLQKQVEQLQAENARLREALQQMVKYARAEGKGLRIADEALASTNSTWLAEHDDEVRRKVLEEVYKEVNCGITHVRWALEIIHRMAKQPESK